MKHSLINQFTTELKSVIWGYPKFVFSGNRISALDGIPVFVYHSIDPELFESHLIYLKTNGYKTLDINEFYEIVVRKKPYNNKKIILLTIDDARSSVWRYGYPLLKKYEMNAVVFVIPGLTSDNKQNKINLFDYWNNKISLKEIEQSDPNDFNLCSWNELKEMYNSEVINIESHTLFHREVFTDINIKKIIDPETELKIYSFSGSAYFKFSDIGRTIKQSDFIGLPIFLFAPLTLQVLK